jgi:hypothetical protein
LYLRYLQTQSQSEKKQFGYKRDQLRLRLYVGEFASGHEDAVRRHLVRMTPPVQVVGLREVVNVLVGLSARRTYVDDPVVMTVKALAAAGLKLDA